MLVILTLLRLSVFVFFILALVFLARNWVRGDKRQKWAVMAGVGVALMASLCLVLDTVAAPDKQSVIRLLMLPGAAVLGVAIWITCYAGTILWDKNGGYWVKNKAGEQWPRAVLWCMLVTAGLGAWSAIVCRLFSVPLLPAKWGSPISTVSYLCSQLAYIFAEEIFYRGWVLGILTVYLAKFRWGNLAALVIASVVFAVQHVNGLHPALIMFIALGGGIAFGLIFQKFGLVAAMGVHLASNLVLTVV